MTPKRIIDSHHHLWDLNAVNYPWLMQRGVKRFFGDPSSIQRNYLPADFAGDQGELNVLGSVHIQVGAENGLDEARWVDQRANDSRFPSAQVAFCDLSNEDLAAHLTQLSEFKSLRGIRQIVGRSPEEDALTGTDRLIGTRAFSQGLRLLEQRQLRFDLQLIPEQMMRMAQLLEAIPNLPVALCHMGSPWYQTGAGFQVWQQGVIELAKNPKVVCKLSGLVMFNHNWNTDRFMPFISHVLEHFGSSRILFGSNFPVDGLHAQYAQLVEAYCECLHRVGGADIDAIFYDNAAQFYDLSR